MTILFFSVNIDVDFLHHYVIIYRKYCDGEQNSQNVITILSRTVCMANRRI